MINFQFYVKLLIYEANNIFRENYLTWGRKDEKKKKMGKMAYLYQKKNFTLLIDLFLSAIHVRKIW